MTRRSAPPKRTRSTTARSNVQTPGQTDRRADRLSDWFAQRRRSILLIVLVASVALRAVYFIELNSGPFINMHRLDETDMHYYEAWARRIAGGDWLSASIAPPMHPWMKVVAERFFVDHPNARTTYAQAAAQAGGATDAAGALWAHWTGGRQFYQDPLYPYLIALTYRIAGTDVRFVFAWQLALGVASNLLIWLLARRFFGDAVAAAAGALAVLAAPLMYYELFLLRESLIVFAGLALVWLTDRAFETRRWTWFAALGVATGAALLLKSTFVIVAAGIAGALIVRAWRSPRALAAPAAAAIAGLAIGFAPLAARNLAVGVPALALASGGPQTFIIANALDYPLERGFSIDAPYIARMMHETDGKMLPAVMRTLRDHTIATFTAMVWRKWDLVWHWYDIPNNENFYYMRLQAPLLAWLLPFWAYAPFALVGLVLAVKSVNRTWPLYLQVACALAPMLVFYVLGRFRTGLLAMVIPLAAFALVELVSWVRNRHVGRALITATAVIVIALWTGRTLAGSPPIIRSSDWFMPYLIHYRDQIKVAVDAGDRTKAVALFLEFFRYEPEPTQFLAPGGAGVAGFFSNMHADCAALMREANRSDEAETQTAQAERLRRIAGG